MSGGFFTLAIIAAVLVGAAAGAYAASEYWQRELHHVRRGAERDFKDEQYRTFQWSRYASDLQSKLDQAYDVIAVLNVRARRTPDLPSDRPTAIGSSTPKKP